MVMNSCRNIKVIVAGLVGTLGLLFACVPGSRPELSDKELVGKQLFFDESLSEPVGQSCGTCHEPAKGFTDKYGRITSEGAVKGLFSNRNSMSCSYVAYVPALYYDEKEETYVGGLF